MKVGGGGDVLKKQRSPKPIVKGIAILFGLFGIVGLLGELGISGFGRGVYSLFKYLLGEAAWIGPISSFIIAIIMSLYPKLTKATKGKSKKSTYLQQKPKPKRIESKYNDALNLGNEFNSGIALPKGKLVNLKGFGEYFSTPEGPDITSPGSLEELEDLGRDFTTYFNEGHEFSFKPLGTRLEPIRGFSSYFDEVSAEIEEEAKKYACPDAGILFPEKREWDYYPGQVASLLKLERKSPSVGVSPAEREALLGRAILQDNELKNAPVQLSEVEIIQAIRERAAEEVENLIEETRESQKRELNRTPEALIPEWDRSSETQEAEVGLPELEVDLTELEVNLPELEVDLPELEVNLPDLEVDLERDVNLLEVEVTTKGEVDRPLEVKMMSIQGSSELLVEMQHEVPLEELTSQKQVSWKLPAVDLLEPLPQVPLVYDPEIQEQLERVLADFGVQAKVIRVARGPVITRYELAPAPGVKISRIVNLADDIALGLAARDVRIEAPIPGKAAIGIEVPNKQPRSVPFREVLETSEFKEGPSKLRIALGKDIANQPVVADLAKMPHLLVAGATGSGKSVCITALINSLLSNARPDEVKFLMVDPKMVELSIYNGIPHLLAPVVTDPKKAAAALKWVVKEMETRYELFAAAGVRDIERYNRTKFQEQRNVNPHDKIAPALPWIVVIIDELADLMMVAANEVEEAICRLAQMARAAGIHLVIATQRPSVDVITGLIKANIPSRISFAVSSQIDSRTILDATGAEKLLGRGDMLYSPQGLNKPLRVQGCWVTDDEVQRVISFWKAQGRPEYLDPEGFTSLTAGGKTESAGPEDELFVEAGHLIITTGMASVSFLQRKLKLGYARAARLMDLLEENAIVGGYEGSKPRQVLISIEEFEERFG